MVGWVLVGALYLQLLRQKRPPFVWVGQWKSPKCGKTPSACDLGSWPMNTAMPVAVCGLALLAMAGYVDGDPGGRGFSRLREGLNASCFSSILFDPCCTTGRPWSLKTASGGCTGRRRLCVESPTPLGWIELCLRVGRGPLCGSMFSRAETGDAGDHKLLDRA